MRFFGTRSAAEADSYWHRHRPELLPKRGFGDWKLTVSALALAGVANVIGALFAPEGDDENAATSGYSGATLPKNSTQAAHDKVVSSEEQSIDFAQAPLDNISSPGAAAPAAGAAQPPAGVSGGTPVVATVNTPVAAPPPAAPPPTASQFPDPKTVRAAASLGPDGMAIATRPPSGTDLAWAHISGEMIALDDGIEALEAVAHGYRAGGFVAGIAGPSAEAGDGPAGPGEGPGRMGVLLFQRAALQFLLQNVQDLDLSFVEDAARRRIAIGGGAGQHELHGDGGADQADHGEFFERRAVLDHALLDTKTLPL